MKVLTTKRVCDPETRDCARQVSMCGKSQEDCTMMTEALAGSAELALVVMSRLPCHHRCDMQKIYIWLSRLAYQATRGRGVGDAPPQVSGALTWGWVRPGAIGDPGWGAADSKRWHAQVPSHGSDQVCIRN